MLWIFQFTPLREGRRCQQRRHRGNADFNSRPSARGDCPQKATRAGAPFQFTPLREGRLGAAKPSQLLALFQFTPLREGRLPRASRCAQAAPISIHAPPRGATRPADQPTSRPASSAISIHAPPRGATALPVGMMAVLDQFQFTPLREGRPFVSE